MPRLHSRVWIICVSLVVIAGMLLLVSLAAAQEGEATEDVVQSFALTATAYAEGAPTPTLVPTKEPTETPTDEPTATPTVETEETEAAAPTEAPPTPTATPSSADAQPTAPGVTTLVLLIGLGAVFAVGAFTLLRSRAESESGEGTE